MNNTSHSADYNMDFQLPLIFLGVFFIALASLFIVYKFGMKEKSYEEALAEQRQQTQTLLGGKVKVNNKDKKSKKATKKQGKEKVTEPPNPADQVDAPVQTDSRQNNKKPHVEFKEAVEEVPIVPSNPVNTDKKAPKKGKVQPILVNKESATENVPDPAAQVESTNHFEELHPKDEFELLRSSSTDELLKQGPSKGAKGKQSGEVEVAKNAKQLQNHPKVKEAPVKEKETKNVDSAGTTVSNGFVANVGKEKKKKKSEFNTLQQLHLSGDKNGLGTPALLDLVRKAELSRNEVQVLIDLLLNKQHEAPAVVDEWSEGKSDPVQKLKKQLSEKENLLAEEQQALQGAQAKLREVRAEQQAERAQLQQKIRGLEEVLQNKQAEIGRFHQQYQQLQVQYNEEVLQVHKLREELANFQVQRQQLEIRLAQIQEHEVIIPQLQNEAQELSAINQQLRMELTRLSEENVTEKERTQAFVVQLSGFQQELEQKAEHIRQIEEDRTKTEQNLERTLRQENDFKVEISRLKSALQHQVEELRRLEHGKNQLQDEIFHLQKQKEESDKTASQCKSEMQKIKEQTAVQTNGSIEETKAHEVEILNLQNELESSRTCLKQTEANLKNELKTVNASFEKLQNELKDQKSKNNDLRTKNWKVMEALNAAESRIKTNGTTVCADQSKPDHDAQQKQFIQRLFPEIKEFNEISPEVFQVECQRYIQSYLEELQKRGVHQENDSEELDQLKSQIQHYKDVIDNTEKMLNNLQKHVEEEEINWRVELAAKTAELEAIKQNKSTEWVEKLTSLENELKREREEKKQLLLEHEQFKNESPRLEKNILENKNQWSEPHDGVNNSTTNGPALIEESSTN